MSNEITITQIEEDLQVWFSTYSLRPLYVNIGTGSFPKAEAPLNIACPRCKASVGFKCKRKQIYPKPWGKKKPQVRAWQFQSEQLPHRERIQASKIQEVEDALDGF